MHHIFLNFYFRSIHIHSVYFKVHWTMKLSSTKTLKLHMNIIVKCSTKWVEKNTEIKLSATLHTVLVIFSRQCVKSKVFPHLGFKTWRCRKNSRRGLILCLRHGFAFLRQFETDTTSSNTAALHRPLDVWHQSTARATECRWLCMLSNRSRGTLMSYADRLRGAAPSRTHRYISPSVGIKAVTSPHHLLVKVK